MTGDTLSARQPTTRSEPAFGAAPKRIGLAPLSLVLLPPAVFPLIVFLVGRGHWHKEFYNSDLLHPYMLIEVYCCGASTRSGRGIISRHSRVPRLADRCGGDAGSGRAAMAAAAVCAAAHGALRDRGRRLDRGGRWASFRAPDGWRRRRSSPGALVAAFIPGRPPRPAPLRLFRGTLFHTGATLVTLAAGGLLLSMLAGRRGLWRDGMFAARVRHQFLRSPVRGLVRPPPRPSR